MTIITSLFLITQMYVDEDVDEIIQQHLKTLIEPLLETPTWLLQQMSNKTDERYAAFQKA